MIHFSLFIVIYCQIKLIDLYANGGKHNKEQHTNKHPQQQYENTIDAIQNRLKKKVLWIAEDSAISRNWLASMLKILLPLNTTRNLYVVLDQITSVHTFDPVRRRRWVVQLGIITISILKEARLKLL